MTKKIFRPVLNRFENYILEKIRSDDSYNKVENSIKHARKISRHKIYMDKYGIHGFPWPFNYDKFIKQRDGDPVLEKIDAVCLFAKLFNSEKIYNENLFKILFNKRRGKRNFENLTEKEYNYFLETSPESIYQRYCFMTPEKESEK